MKQCTKCKEIKPKTEFYKHPHGDKDGFGPLCKECKKKQVAAYQKTEKGKEAVKRYHRKTYQKHPRKKTNIRRPCYKWGNNPEVRKKYYREYYKINKHKPRVRLSYAIRGAINYSLREGRKTKKTFDMLDFTIDELRAHLEAQFQPGMSWDNYGEWHIDHKIPIKAFNFDRPEQIDFKRCWALENLQPMWADKNIRKAAKLKGQFQPMLKLESA